MSSTLAPVWFKFFLEAGIPPSDAGNYAVTFTENRIQPDMMTDLTKDYLAEMGITVLGDVIAIMKHAKVVHTQTAREKALQCTGLSRELPVSDDLTALNRATAVQPAKLSQKPSLSVHKKTAPEHAATLKTTPVSQNKTAPEKLSSPAQNQPVVRVAPSSESVASTSSVKAVSKLAKSDNQTNGAKIRLRVPQDEVLLPQKSSKEEILKITTNGAVSSVQTQPKKVSQSNSESNAMKSSVFNRLGREVSNSDLRTTNVSPVKTLFQVTVKSTNNDGVMQSKSKPTNLVKSPIFNRLGSKTDIQSPVTSTSITDSTVKLTGTKAVAVPVGKRPLVSKTVKNLKQRLGPPTSSSPVATVSSTSEGIFGTEASHSGSVAPAKLRLGVKRPATSSTTELAVPVESKKAKTDIRARLGLPTTASTSEARPVKVAKPIVAIKVASSKSSGVFGRLGSVK